MKFQSDHLTGLCCIASVLLPRGMTSHRTFKLPLDLNNIENAFLKLESDKKKIKGK